MTIAKVSVIIPAYRAARTIGRAVASVLAQTRPADEILVIDDGSPDDLSSALGAYEGQVTLVRKCNGGAASARNFGMDRARGEFIAFLDADDYWEPQKLERQLNVFEAHPGLGLVASLYFEEQPGESRVPRGAASDVFVNRVLTAGQDALMEIVRRVWISTVLARWSVVDELRFTPGLEPAEDRDMWIRLAARRPVYVLGHHLATAVLEPGSLSRSSVERDRANMLRVIRQHQNLLTASQQRAWETSLFRAWAADHLGKDDPGRALWPAWQRFCRQPLAVEAWYVVTKCLLRAAAKAGPWPRCAVS